MVEARAPAFTDREHSSESQPMSARPRELLPLHRQRAELENAADGETFPPTKPSDPGLGFEVCGHRASWPQRHEPALKTWSSHAGPMVRIRLPPAGRLLRTPIEPGATRVSS